MIKQDLLDYELYLDDKHIADFDELKMAKDFGFLYVDTGHANEAVIINKWTGEVMWRCFTRTERKVIEE